MPNDSTEWVEELLVAFRAAKQEHDILEYDIHWLESRCMDTLRYEGAQQRLSLRELRKEVAEFDVEFPGIVPSGIREQLR